eukprot:6212740-Pleurochrysis_carterae.AAC.6
MEKGAIRKWRKGPYANGKNATSKWRKGPSRHARACSLCGRIVPAPPALRPAWPPWRRAPAAPPANATHARRVKGGKDRLQAEQALKRLDANVLERGWCAQFLAVQVCSGKECNDLVEYFRPLNNSKRAKSHFCELQITVRQSMMRVTPVTWVQQVRYRSADKLKD